MASNDQRLSKLRGLTVGQLQMLRQARLPTTEGIEKMPDYTMRRTLKRLEYSDMPGEREWYRRLQHRTDGGRTEAHPLVGALRDLDSLRLRQDGTDGVAAPQVGCRTMRLSRRSPPSTAPTTGRAGR